MSREKVEPPDNLTPQELRLFNLLSDGLFKVHADLRVCLWDELSETPQALNTTVHRLRAKLVGSAFDVVCERRGFGKDLTWVYRMVRRLDCPPK